MDYQRFIEIVQKRAHVDPETAEAAARATLQTLAERISPAERQELAEWLPPDLRPAVLAVEGPRQVFHLADFFRRVSQREKVKVPIAEEHARAVVAALGVVLSPAQLAHLAEELSPDFDRLVAEARETRDETTKRTVPALAADEFLARVARRTGLRQEDARRATEAVLETLAERISGTEGEAMMGWLPAELHPALRRGLERTQGEPRAMPLEEFLRLVAEREGTSRNAARDHARAVVTTLREAVNEREFSHLEAELPDEYVVLLP